MDPYYSGVEPAADPGISPLWWVVIGALGFAIFLLVVMAIVRNLRYVARPNQALIFSGKSYTNEEGQTIGYRVVRAGQHAYKIPFLERLDHIDMTLIPADVVVHNAYSRGNIPLQIHAIANVKIHSESRHIGNAIERFLGKPLAEIQLVAQQTLEGALREVLAQLTPEEVNQDRLKFAQSLIEAADDDLDKLGLQLDTLKIQSVSDQTGYLDSLGRPAIAQALRDAENAENQAMQEITQAQAEATRRAEVARAEAQTLILQKQNELRAIRATLEGEAQSIEREAEAAAKTARAAAERELQQVRAELEKKRLEAEVIIPSEFQRRAKAIIAVGEAAPTRENGVAAVEVLRMMTDAWRDMGPQAKELYVIQHLEQIVGTVVSQLKSVEVDQVHVLDPGDGSGLSSYAATYPKMVAEVMRALKETTGVDVPQILGGGDNKPAIQPQKGA
ncbi:MAG: flotillin family protein [Sandaracinaceae bacterium]|nr:flotillin family protein [Sandaracinaceae bacterium]